MEKVTDMLQIKENSFDVLRAYNPEEWVQDKDWLANRLCFLYERRYSSYYPDLQEEIQKIYEYFGTDNYIMGKASELFYK